MQVIKEEIRRDIVGAAKREFLKRGYQNASMRVIAKRANTSIGNLYHYFPNKEAILDEVVQDMPERLVNMLNAHKQYEFENMDTLTEMTPVQLISLIDQFMPQLFETELLLEDSTIILLEGCEGTKYAYVREAIISVFKGHLAEHLAGNKNELLVNTLIHTVVMALLYIAKNKNDVEQGYDAIQKYLKLIIVGMMFDNDFTMDDRYQK